MGLSSRIIAKIRYEAKRTIDQFIFIYRKRIHYSEKEALERSDDLYYKQLKQLHTCGGDLANYEQLIKHKSSDVLFILGSGPSINDLSASNWQEISEHDSVGFNLFMAHSFIPTYYHMELTPKFYDIVRSWHDNNAQRIGKMAFMFFFRHLDMTRDFSDYLFPANCLFTVPRYPYVYQNDRTFKKVLNHYYFQQDIVSENFYLHHRASVSLLISMGVMLGYKEIILLGIDLNNPDYFFEDKDKYPGLTAQRCREYVAEVRSNLVKKGQWSRFHLTAEKSLHPISYPIDEFIYRYRDIVMKKLDIKLKIGNSASLLYPRLEKYDFTEN